MTHQTGSLMRSLGVGVGLKYHQPAPGSAFHPAVVPGLDAVPKAVLSWYIPSSAAACGVGASGTLGRGPMTGSSGPGESLRRTWDGGAMGQRWGAVCGGE